jgi:hypothetical protein
MSTKIELNLVAAALKQENVEPAKARAILETLQLEIAAQEKGEDGEKAPHVKKQYCILVSDPEGVMPKQDLVGWVLQIPESESPASTQERIFRSAYDFNATKKGRLLPVKTVGEAIENVPAKFFKEADLWAKTKTPVLVLRTDNQIPRDVSAKE